MPKGHTLKSAHVCKGGAVPAAGMCRCAEMPASPLREALHSLPGCPRESCPHSAVGSSQVRSQCSAAIYRRGRAPEGL
eukprot:9945211-Alexandrium_andersonii.AAC.1